MMFMKRFLMFIVGALFLFSCEDTTNNSRIIVTLTDSPGDYAEVNVQVIGIEIHRQSGNQESGWISLDMESSKDPERMNLLLTPWQLPVLCNRD